MENVTIREVKLEDVTQLLDIYGYYVCNTAITFETQIPTKEDFIERIKSITAKYPYLVAEANGKILGYSYAHAYNTREAYDWCVEMTIYLDKDCRGAGLGKKLYEKMEECLKSMNIKNLYSCIAATNKPSKYLTNASIDFHKALGYEINANFKQSGYKFNEWFDMVWMEKIIGDHELNPKTVEKFKGLTSLN